jgi:AcrR family transcriptional regulator
MLLLMSPGMALQQNPDQPDAPTPEATLAYRQAMGETPVAVRPTPGDAFNAARQRFRAGDKLDMVALAEDLRISRATLYRWTGDRDRLLADILIAELHSLIRAATTRATGTGVARLESAIGWFLNTLAGLPSLRAFLVNERDNGLRMVTSPTGPVRPRIVETVTEVINRETVDGGYRPPAPPELLADGIIALAERYLHNGGDPTLNPDPTTARTIAGLLLREPCT